MFCLLTKTMQSFYHKKSNYPINMAIFVFFLANHHLSYAYSYNKEGRPRLFENFETSHLILARFLLQYSKLKTQRSEFLRPFSFLVIIIPANNPSKTTLKQKTGRQSETFQKQ